MYTRCRFRRRFVLLYHPEGVPNDTKCLQKRHRAIIYHNRLLDSVVILTTYVSHCDYKFGGFI